MRVEIHQTGKIPSKKNQMIVSGKRLIKDNQVRLFEASLRGAAISVMTAAGIQPTDKPVNLHLEVTFGDKRRRDVQNCFGSICDALNDIVYLDDSQIQMITGKKKYNAGEWCYSIYVETT